MNFLSTEFTALFKDKISSQSIIAWQVKQKNTQHLLVILAQSLLLCLNFFNYDPQLQQRDRSPRKLVKLE